MRIGIKSLQDFMSFLVRRRWWVIVPFIALSCLVAILTKELPKVFVSEALVIVKPRDVPENFVMDLNSNSGQQRLKSIQQMVLSRTNLVGILDEFESQMPDLRTLSRDEAVDRLRKQISIRFSVEPDARGAMNVIYFTISCQDKNPQMAQTIVTRLTRLFLVRDSEQRASQALYSQPAQPFKHTWPPPWDRFAAARYGPPSRPQHRLLQPRERGPTQPYSVARG